MERPERDTVALQRQVLRWVAIIGGAALVAVVGTSLLAGLLETLWLQLGSGTGDMPPPE